jgi:hypothetical protein
MIAYKPGLFAVVTDWHVTSDDAEQGGLGDTRPKEARAVAEHIRGLRPAGAVCLGDLKDHYGPDTGDELDQYLANVADRMPWAEVNPVDAGGVAIDARFPALRGNHDEVYDYTEVGTVTDFSIADAKLWPSKHWTTDWGRAEDRTAGLSPKIRFIGVHTTIIHAPNAEAGFFSITQAEIDWLAAEIAALPAGYKAIVVAHTSFLDAVGNNVGPSGHNGQAALLALLAANATKIICCLGGHRHLNFQAAATQDGIKHFSLPSMAYNIANSNGGFTLLQYVPANNAIVVHYRMGPGSSSMFHEISPATFTPVSLTLSPSATYIAIMADAPALYWRLGETSGTNANDETANDRDGTYTNGPTLGAAGLLANDTDKAVSFTADTQKITSAYTVGGAGVARTWECWHYRTAKTNNATLVGTTNNSDQMIALTAGTDDIRCVIGGVTVTWAGAHPGLNQAVHLAVVFDDVANTAKLYVNGALVSSQAHAGVLQDGPLAVGGSQFGNQSARGVVDELAIFHSAISAARIAAHRAAGI